MKILRCDTLYCLAPAEYWCAWGCLEQHVADGKFCTPCMTSKRHTALMEPCDFKLKCFAGHWAADFFYSSVTDTRHIIIEAQ